MIFPFEKRVVRVDLRLESRFENLIKMLTVYTQQKVSLRETLIRQRNKINKKIKKKESDLTKSKSLNKRF